MVYALCIFHCCMNAGIQKSNIRKFCVQWAKTANLEDQESKFKQLHTTGITRNQWAYMEENWKDVTYLGLIEVQKLDINHEVVVISNNMGEENNDRIQKTGLHSMAPVDHTIWLQRLISDVPKPNRIVLLTKKG